MHCETFDGCISYINESVEDFLFKSRRINLVGEVDNDLANTIISQLQYYSKSKHPVYMYISTQGGSWGAGHAIIDQMQMSPFDLYTIVRGEAFSMGAIIAAYGTTGCRCITKGSSMLLHSMIFNPSGDDSITSYKRCTDFWHDDYNKKIKNFAKRTKFPYSSWIKIFEENKWMSPDDAISYGIIDKIWTKKDEMAIQCVE